MFPSLYGVVSQGAAAASWWVVAGKTCVAAYQPIGAASLAASYVNLANPGTYNAAPGVAPTWASGTGWTFNGSTQYLTTGVVPNSEWSMIARWSVSARPVLIEPMIGIRNDGAKRFYINPTWGGTISFFGYGSNQVSTPNSATSGVAAITKSAHYIDGVPYVWSPSAFVGDVGILIGDVPGIANKYTGNIQAVAIYSDTLSSAEVATLSAAMAAL